MKTGISHVLDKAISDYQDSIGNRTRTQIKAYVAAAVVDQTKEFGGDMDAAMQNLVSATTQDIESAYNLDMRIKLLDVALAVAIKQVE